MSNVKVLKLLLLEDLKSCHCMILNPLALQQDLNKFYSTSTEKYKFILNQRKIYECYSIDLDNREVEIMVDCILTKYNFLKTKDGLNVVDNETLIPILDTNSFVKTEDRMIVRIPIDKVSAILVIDNCLSIEEIHD